jgi:hypothetical protein
MHWAEARGLPSVVSALDALAASGLAKAPCPLLRRAAEKGSFAAAID